MLCLYKKITRQYIAIHYNNIPNLNLVESIGFFNFLVSVSFAVVTLFSSIFCSNLLLSKRKLFGKTSVDPLREIFLNVLYTCFCFRTDNNFILKRIFLGIIIALRYFPR